MDHLAAPIPGQPYSLPLPQPDATSKPAPARDVTPAQRQQVQQLIDHFNESGFTLPTNLSALKQQWKKRDAAAGRGSWFSSFGAGGGGSGSSTPSKSHDEQQRPLNDVEKCYCSEEHFHRVFRAVKWDHDAALKRAESIVVWRREAGVEEMTAEHVSPEGETGKEIVFGYDKQARPVLYMHPYRQNTETGPRQIDFVIWTLERTIDLCPPTVPVTDMLCLCIDFGASKKVKAPPTSLGQAKKVLDILQTYYCERLGRAVCCDIPSFFWAFYRLVGPFVDPRTKEKIKFLEKNDATDLIPASQLQSIFGGDVDLQYNHSTYFKALNDLCMERKRQNLERWRKYGRGQCGLSETIIRGAVVPDGEDEGERTATNSTSAASTVVEEHTRTASAVSKDDAAPVAAVNGETLKIPAAATARNEAVAEGLADLSLSDSKPTSPAPPRRDTQEQFVDAPTASEAAVNVAVTA